MKSRPKVFLRLVLAVLWAAGGASAQGPKADPPWLAEYIPSASLGLIMEGASNLVPAPSAEPGEMGRSLDYFSDRSAAEKALHAFRGPRGRIFANFLVSDSGSNPGSTTLLCGRTNVWSQDWDDIEEARISRTEGAVSDWAHHESFGTFNNLKRTTSRERSFAIAECLAKLPGMPSLKPVRPDLKSLYINEGAYTVAIGALQGMDPPAVRGSDDQYRQVFRCLVTEASRRWQGVGRNAAVRAIWIPGPEDSGIPSRWYLAMSVMDTKDAVDKFFRVPASDFGAAEGLWKTRFSLDDAIDRVTGIVGADVMRDSLWGCRLKAGLFVLPPQRFETNPNRCPVAP